MALTKLTENLNNIQALSDKPNETDGLSADELKERFDLAGNTIKTYINGTLTEELDAINGTICTENTVDTKISTALSSYYTKSQVDTALNGKQKTISYGTGTPADSFGINGDIYIKYN